MIRMPTSLAEELKILARRDRRTVTQQIIAMLETAKSKRKKIKAVESALAEARDSISDEIQPGESEPTGEPGVAG